MSHYLMAQLNGGKYAGSSVLSPAGMAQLHAGTAPAGLSALNGSYAMGWFSGRRGKIAQTVWHDGSAAGMHAMVVMVPAKDYGVVVLTNSESALYEFLARTDVIADNVASMLLGLPLGGTLAGLYIGFDIAALLIVALALRNLIRLIRRGPRRYTGRLARTRTIAFNWVVPIWRELWVPIAIVVGLPVITGAPWSGNLVTTDLGQWLLVLAGILLATGVTRLTVQTHLKESIAWRNN
jgi:Beta-lactamase